MIDTWLVSTLVTTVLFLFAVYRGVTAKVPDDRLVAGTVAVILLSLSALTLSIAWGMLLILDIMILAALAAFCGMIWYARQPEAGDA